jgi:single-stranded DNA-binding protein
MNLTKISWGNGTRRRVQVWEEQELAKIVVSDLRRGVRVSVEGRRAIRRWIDRENGEHCHTEIVASDVRFLDPARKGEARNGDEGAGLPPCLYEES